METVIFDPGFGTFLNTAPKLITRGASLMNTYDEKIMAIYASTTMTSALEPHVWINYNDKINYTQIYVVSVKPPGSGKGKLALFPRLIAKVNNELIQNNNQLIKQYNIRMKIYESKQKKQVSDEPLEMPEKPKLKLVSLSGNTTSSMLIQQFDQNDGEMALLIYETEIDGLTNMMNNLKFGGDNSMVFRKSYHNEPITQMRKGNAESLIANNPKLAIFLTGTPSQIKQLFKSNEDGLFSRFVTFTGGEEDVWKSVKPCETCDPLDESFDIIGESYYAFYHHMKNRKMQIVLSESQWEIVEKIGPEWHAEAKELGGENATSIAKRHVNMIVRVAANYSAIRVFEEKIEGDLFECYDEDFVNAQWLIEMSFRKALQMFKELPGEKLEANKEDEIFGHLPDFFKKSELAALKSQLRISDKTLERRLAKLVSLGKLNQTMKGYYQKANQSKVTDDGLSN